MSRFAVEVLVAGRVQGVGFRWWTRERAAALGVDGWVRNLDDGRVEAHLEGEEAAVRRLLAELERGPPAARVRSTSTRDGVPGGLRGFDARPTARGPASG